MMKQAKHMMELYWMAETYLQCTEKKIAKNAVKRTKIVKMKGHRKFRTILMEIKSKLKYGKEMLSWVP